MRRAFLGSMIGGATAFVIGFAVGLVTLKATPDAAVGGLFMAVILAGNGAMAGAIVGACGDLLAHLREALPVRYGPEADYGEGPLKPGPG